jgi:uncharacterized protein (TIGR02594 family)
MIRLLNKALDYIGIKEMPGVENNPTILGFFKSIGQSWVQSDETAWCSAFVNYVCKSEGFEYTGKLNARSWLTVGTHIDEPARGCIVVLWRVDKNGWQGHVGFYVRHDGDYIYILGGNQDNSVSIKAYPKERLLSYRILKQKT